MSLLAQSHRLDYPFQNLLNRHHRASYPAWGALQPPADMHVRVHSGHNRVHDVDADDDDHDRTHTMEWPHVLLDHDSSGMLRSREVQRLQRMDLNRPYMGRHKMMYPHIYIKKIMIQI